MIESVDTLKNTKTGEWIDIYPPTDRLGGTDNLHLIASVHGHRERDTREEEGVKLFFLDESYQIYILYIFQHKGITSMKWADYSEIESDLRKFLSR